MRKRIAVWLALLLFLLNGCNTLGADERTQSAKDGKAAELDTFLEEAVYDFTYEKPINSPNILLNRNGYDKTDSKVAFFKGKELPKEFQVVDKESKKIVYCGKIENVVFDSKNGEYFGKGDFSDIEEEGSYYLQAKYIGRSYSFEVTQERFRIIYDNIIESFYYHRCGTNLVGESSVNNHIACHKGETYIQGTDEVIDTTGGWHTDQNFNKNVVESTKIISDLMLTYEFLHDGGNVAKEELEQGEFDTMESLLNEVYYEVQFLLKMQDEKTGAFYGSVESRQKLEVVNPEEDEREFYVTKISETATAECVAVLSQFSRMYKKIDSKTADQCLDAAIKGYSYLEKKQYISEGRYYAACELYKTTGISKYSQYILQYLKKQESVSDNSIENQQNEDSEENSNTKFSRKIYGDLAYLTTTYKVDMELSSNLMNDLMIQAQYVSACAKEDAYLVYGNNEKRDSKTILEGAFLLAIIDHIVTSHEYVGVMENQLDYLFGRNETGENLVTNKGVLRSVEEEEEYDLYLQSSLVFILHELIEREAE